MSKVILVSNLMMLKEQERFSLLLKDHGFEPLFPRVSQYLDKRMCLEFAGEIDGWLAGDDQIDEEVVQAFLPRLKVISKWGTGLDSIDVDYCKRVGLPVFNTPGAFGEAVGELAVGYIISLTREIVTTHMAVSSGCWPKFQHRSLSELTIGLIGFGAIGRGIANRLSPFGCNIVFSDPSIENGSVSFSNINKVDLSTLREASDVVVLCCNLTAENKHMINEDFISMMKSGSFIVNVSRGPLIDENALIAGLSSGRLSGAALDVYELEPLSLDNSLRKCNVILGSHNANNTRSAVEYVHNNTINNLLNVFI